MAVISIIFVLLRDTLYFIKMLKSIFVIALIGFVYANPVPDESDDLNDAVINNAAAAGAGQAGGFGDFGKWPMPDFKNFQIKFPMPDFSKFEVPSPESIANLKPGPNGVVNGVSTSISSHTEWKDGKPVTKTEGKYLINKNGVVESGSIPEKKSSTN